MQLKNVSKVMHSVLTNQKQFSNTEHPGCLKALGFIYVLKILYNERVVKTSVHKLG